MWLFSPYSCFTWILKQIYSEEFQENFIAFIKQFSLCFKHLIVSIFIRELYGKKKQFLALNSSSSTSQSLIFRLRAWSAVGMIRHCHASYSHRKFSRKTLKSKNSASLPQFYHCLNFPPPHQSNSCTFLPNAHLSLPLGALWGGDHSPLCSTRLFFLLDLGFAQQNPEVFNKPM